MYVKQFCLVLLLAFICVSWADVDSTVDGKSGVQNVSENVFPLRRTCISDADCLNSGKCERVSSGKFCKCKNGTSGDLCEKVDECVDNPKKCGTMDDVACVFDVRNGTAVCKCVNETKIYVEDRGRCMRCNCGDHGKCSLNSWGMKMCTCEEGYKENEGKCLDCKCGREYNGCKFENGTKICLCWPGEALKDGICQKCDCGLGRGVSKCEFKNGKKVCTCKDGYSLIGPDGPCKQKCNATTPCANGGKCVQNLCNCLKGTSGDLCKLIDECKGWGKCGSVKCLYNVSSQEPYCKCDGSLTFDDYYKECKACNCGSYARSCTFVKGKKICNCSDPYEDRLGKCTLCFCKGYSSMYGCKFDDNGNMKCPCLKGYSQIGDECKKCDCGEHGKCHHYGYWSKYCVCDEGYVENEGVCRECNCGMNGNCQMTNYGQKTCSCYNGYQEYEGTCKACDCGGKANCRFSEFGTKVCTCHTNYAMKNGTCTPCNCGLEANCTFTSDIFFGDKKVCDCPEGYADDQGNCRNCDCEVKRSNCTFSFGLNRCQCPKGYTEATKPYKLIQKFCEDIDECKNSYRCPLSSTKCVNTPGSYECVCEEGYTDLYSLNIERDGCKDINECARMSQPCIDDEAKCVNTPGSYRCECRSGYSLKSSDERRNICSPEFSSRPWRTGSFVVGVSAGIIIIGLLIAISKKYSL